MEAFCNLTKCILSSASTVQIEGPDGGPRRWPSGAVQAYRPLDDIPRSMFFLFSLVVCMRQSTLYLVGSRSAFADLRAGPIPARVNSLPRG